MASSINASTSGAGGVITTADNSGVLNLQSGGTTVATVSSTGLSTPANQTINTANTFGFKNRIINGGMVIDQRNAGASTTPTGDGTYNLDRWGAGMSAASKFSVQQNAGSVTPPTGFSNYLGITSLAATSLGATDYYLVYQKIEGFNTADLAWGTASAKTVTLSFWVYSSLTGSFGGSLSNSAQNRNYPFSYTVSSANTWTQVSVTIAGDTTGTWIGATNGTGMLVRFSLGVGSTYSGTANAWTGSSFIFQPTGSVSVVGTNGATWYITGVQLEVGSQATSFDFRSYGQELLLCMRYYWKNLSGSALASLGGQGACSSVSALVSHFVYSVPMRASPTFSTSGANIGNGAAGTGIASVGTSYIGPNGAQIIINGTSSPFAGGNGGYVYDAGTGTGFVAFSAEL